MIEQGFCNAQSPTDDPDQNNPECSFKSLLASVVEKKIGGTIKISKFYSQRYGMWFSGQKPSITIFAGNKDFTQKDFAKYVLYRKMIM